MATGEYQLLLAKGLSIPTGGDVYATAESSITTGTTDTAITMTPVTTAFCVEIINDETTTGRNLTVTFNAITNADITVNAGESTTFDKLAEITAIYLSNSCGATINYRIRIYGVA